MLCRVSRPLFAVAAAAANVVVAAATAALAAADLTLATAIATGAGDGLLRKPRSRVGVHRRMH